MDDAHERGWLRPPPSRTDSCFWIWLQRIASLRFTLYILGLLGIAVVWAYFHVGSTTWPLVLPLSLFALNLLAAIGVQPAFSRHLPLLIFHLALLALIILVTAGRLTYLNGHTELARGGEFSGTIQGVEAGPWHSWHADQLWFVNEGFAIDYQPGIKRDHTRNQVRYRDLDGVEQTLIIGDQVPLELQGYRFYTSFNKGFALQFVWLPASGSEALRGQVHLPSYPINEYRQANTWTPPGTPTEFWIQLQFDEQILDPEKPSQFRAPEKHRVVVRWDEQRVVLKPGMRVKTPEGTLVYEDLTTWMGYAVRYDWTLPWLLAACLVAVLSLAWYFWGKYTAQPWRLPEEINE